MSEYSEVEQPFLQQLKSLGWITIDPGQSLRQTFRQWILSEVFAKAVSAINTTSA